MALENKETTIQEIKTVLSVEGTDEFVSAISTSKEAVSDLQGELDTFSSIAQSAGEKMAEFAGSVLESTAKDISKDVLKKLAEQFLKVEDGAAKASIAQELLNIAQNASPALFLITAVVGVTAALLSFASETNNVSDEMQELIDKHEMEMAALDEFRSKILSVGEERKTQISDINNESTALEKLAGRLITLSNEETKTTGTKATMSAIVKQLNKEIPGLNLEIDEQTGLLSKNEEAIKANVEAYMAQEKAEAATQSLYDSAVLLSQAESDRKEKVEAVRDAKIALGEAEEALDEKQKEFNETYGESELNYLQLEEATAGYREEVDLATANLVAANEAQNTACISLLLAQVSYDSASDSVDEYALAAAEAQLALIDLNMTQVDFKDTVYNVTEESAAKMNDLITKYWEVKESAQESIRGQLGLFDEFKVESEFSFEQMIANMQGQADATNNWAANLEEASRRCIDEGLIQSLAEAGPASAGYLQEILDNTSKTMDENGQEVYEGVADINDAWTNKLTAEEAAAIKMADLQTNIYENLDAIDKEDKQTVENLRSHWEQAGMANAAGNEMSSLNSIITINLGRVENDMSPFVRRIGAFGGSMTGGLSESWTSGFPEFIKIVKTDLGTLETSAKNVLKINSPSKVFMRIGSGIGEGLEDGSVQSISEAEHTITEMMEDIAAISPDINVDSGSYSLNHNSTDTNSYISDIIGQVMKNIEIRVVSELDGRVIADTTTPIINANMGRMMSRSGRGC